MQQGLFSQQANFFSPNAWQRGLHPCGACGTCGAPCGAPAACHVRNNPDSKQDRQFIVVGFSLFSHSIPLHCAISPLGTLPSFFFLSRITTLESGPMTAEGQAQEYCGGGGGRFRERRRGVSGMNPRFFSNNSLPRCACTCYDRCLNPNSFLNGFFGRWRTGLRVWVFRTPEHACALLFGTTEQCRCCADICQRVDLPRRLVVRVVSSVLHSAVCYAPTRDGPGSEKWGWSVQK